MVSRHLYEDSAAFSYREIETTVLEFSTAAERRRNNETETVVLNFGANVIWSKEVMSMRYANIGIVLTFFTVVLSAQAIGNCCWAESA
jgi:hypothetical protein